MINSVIRLAQGALSLIFFAILGVTGHVDTVTTYRDSLVFVTDIGAAGFTTGEFINVHRVYASPQLIAHEYGHVLQSRKLGWLALPLTAIPSMAIAAMTTMELITFDQGRAMWPESWATELGDDIR